MRSVMAVVVSYNPVIPLLRQDLEALLAQLDRVILMDNGSENIGEVRALSGQFERLQLLENGKNLGLPMNYNRAARMARDEGFAWLLTMDQDTVIPEGMIDAFLQYADIEDVAVIGPVIWDISRKSLENVLAGLPDEPCTFVDEYKLISSASMLRVETLLSLGGFDEKLFIDWVDFDYNKNALVHGHRILRVNTCVVRHQIGNHPEGHFKFLGRTIPLRRYTPPRYYYIYRNRVYFMHKYGLPISFRRKFYKGARKWAIKTLLSLPYDRQALKKVLMMLRGLRDGRRL